LAEQISGEMERKIKINLKKQSQLLKGKFDAMSVLTMAYGDFGR
jgi:hypothetical protein